MWGPEGLKKKKTASDGFQENLRLDYIYFTIVCGAMLPVGR